jgi:hypothetical protein
MGGVMVRAAEDIDVMREALEAVEWLADNGYLYCPWCGDVDNDLQWDQVIHKPDCLRQRALGIDSAQDEK